MKLANRFGFKTKGVVEKNDKPSKSRQRKKQPLLRIYLPGVETKEAKLKREIEERKAERKKKEKTKITEKQFKQEYKKFEPKKLDLILSLDYLNK